MIAERIGTPEEFLAKTLEFRESEPAQTNLIGSVALAVSQGIQVYTHYYWWIVRSGEKVVGCGMHTAPQGFGLSPMTDEAAQVLGTAVAESDEIPFPSIHGPFAPSIAFKDAYCKTKGSYGTKVSTRTMLLYEIETLKKPVNVQGSFRLCTLDDLPLVVEWSKQFFIDAELHETVDHEQRNRDKIKEGMEYFWEKDGVPVAWGGHAVPVASGNKLVARIGPIYTPKQYRKNGYGSAITAEITEILQNRVAKVMLFADAGNPHSNAIYQAIGYQLTCDVAEIRFVE